MEQSPDWPPSPLHRAPASTVSSSLLPVTPMRAAGKGDGVAHQTRSQVILGGTESIARSEEFKLADQCQQRSAVLNGPKSAVSSRPTTFRRGRTSTRDSHCARTLRVELDNGRRSLRYSADPLDLNIKDECLTRVLMSRFSDLLEQHSQERSTPQSVSSNVNSTFRSVQAEPRPTDFHRKT